MLFQYDDGGRKAAGYKTQANDCVCRAIAIVSHREYSTVYSELSKLCGHPASRSIKRAVYHEYILSMGFTWYPMMNIGTGCKVHLSEHELHDGRLIVKVSKHLTAVIDGVIHDTFDPSRNGSRCVYGYYQKVDCV